MKQLLYLLASVLLLGAIRHYFLDYVAHHMLHEKAADVSAEFKQAVESDERTEPPGAAGATVNPPAPSSSITFYSSDDGATLISKSRALLQENNRPEALKLGAFLDGVIHGPPLADKIMLERVAVDQAGKLIRHIAPCDVRGESDWNCGEDITIDFEGDLQDVRDTQDGGAVGTDKNGACYIVSPRDLAILRDRRKQIDNLLQPFGKQLEADPELSGTQLRLELAASRRRRCEPVASAVNESQAERDRANKERADAEFKPFNESVCAKEVVVYKSTPIYDSDQENRDHGNRWIAIIYPRKDGNRLRVIETTSAGTHIELIIRGNHFEGWVPNGAVETSGGATCPERAR